MYKRHTWRGKNSQKSGFVVFCMGKLIELCRTGPRGKGHCIYVHTWYSGHLLLRLFLRSTNQAGCRTARWILRLCYTSCLLSMSHVSYLCVMSPIYASCLLYMSRVFYTIRNNRHTLRARLRWSHGRLCLRPWGAGVSCCLDAVGGALHAIRLQFAVWGMECFLFICKQGFRV